MRFDLIVRNRLGFSATFEMDQRFLEWRRNIPTLSTVYEMADWMLRTYLEAFGITTAGATAEVRVLSLVPHPEFFEGPRDPDWERMLERCAIEHDANRLTDWLDGAYYARREAARSLLGVGSYYSVVDLRVDYAYARDMLLERGWEYDRACRVALAATLKPSGMWPSRFYQPL
jgi:hypothetical protein